MDYQMMLKFNPDQLEKVVAKAVEQETGRKVVKVIFNTSTKYDYRDTKTTEFSGCTITLGDSVKASS